MRFLVIAIWLITVIAVNGSDHDIDTLGFQVAEKSSQLGNFIEAISLEQDLETQSRKGPCRKLEGRCIRKRKDCPNGLPVVKEGGDYCSKGRKCCSPGSKCGGGIICESVSQPWFFVCGGRPDMLSMETFAGICYLDLAIKCNPQYWNYTLIHNGPCRCLLQPGPAVGICITEHPGYYYNVNTGKCEAITFNRCGPKSPNFFGTYDLCSKTCARKMPGPHTVTTL